MAIVAPTRSTPPPTVLIANPGFDRYGSDLQMLESVIGLRSAGWEVVVAAPAPGPLQGRLHELGARTEVIAFPIVRRQDTSPRGAARLAVTAAAALPSLRRLIRELAPDLVYVNTVTLPWWLAAARTCRVPTLCHVHEAEPTVRRVIRRAMAAQLRLADAAVVNSRITLDSLAEVAPFVRGRAHLVYNGVPEGPPPVARASGEGPHVVVVGRLSPRKAPHVALEAVAQLRQNGLAATLELCGTPVPGQEDYEHSLRARAAQPDLAGAVNFAGYTSPVWDALDRADVFLATSTAEPFGNAVVEAQLAGRPVVATAVEGHLETVLPEETGLLVPVGDAAAMARAITRLFRDPTLAARLTDRARTRAQELFSVEQYRAAMVDLVTTTARVRPSAGPAAPAR